MTTGITHTYKNNSEITFQYDREGLSVSIKTERLHMNSVSKSDFPSLVRLFGDKTVMQKLLTGETRTEERTKKTYDYFRKCWEENNPYSALSVNNNNEFLGIVVLTKDDDDTPGVAELSGLGFSSYWKNGYGTEAADAIVKEYAPATIKEGHTISGRTLQKIIATARPDNEGSWKILEKHLGMKHVGDEVKYGSTRKCYSIDIKV